LPMCEPRRRAGGPQNAGSICIDPPLTPSARGAAADSVTDFNLWPACPQRGQRRAGRDRARPEPRRRAGALISFGMSSCDSEPRRRAGGAPARGMAWRRAARTLEVRARRGLRRWLTRPMSLAPRAGGAFRLSDTALCIFLAPRVGGAPARGMTWRRAARTLEVRARRGSGKLGRVCCGTSLRSRRRAKSPGRPEPAANLFCQGRDPC
jgi:hypothetical protein